MPVQSTSLGPALAAAAALVKSAEDEAKTVTEQLDEPEREALRQAFGEGSTGKGVAKAMRGVAGAMKDLEDRQKSRATRVKRDTLDGALLDLAAFYRDVLMVQSARTSSWPTRTGMADLRRLAAAGTAGGDAAPHPGGHAVPGAAHAQRRAAARGRGADGLARPGLTAERVQRDQHAAGEGGRHDHDRHQRDHAQQGGRQAEADREHPAAAQHRRSPAQADAAPVKRDRDDLERHEPPGLERDQDRDDALPDYRQEPGQEERGAEDQRAQQQHDAVADARQRTACPRAGRAAAW